MDELTVLLRDLKGLSCLGVDNPRGSVLRLDLGELAHRVDDVPGAHPHGWRHLTVLSPWRIEDDTTVICDWTDPGGVHGVLQSSIAVLHGLVVDDIELTAPSFDLVIRFSDKYKLSVFSDVDDSRTDAWFILGTDGLEVAAAPQRRGEGGYVIRHKTPA